MASVSPKQLLVFILSSDNSKTCIETKAMIPQLMQNLPNFDILTYEVESLVDCFHYRNCSYPSVIGNLFWLPFVISTDDLVWADIQNGIDRRSELKVLNGKFDGSKFIDIDIYTGYNEFQDEYIQPYDVNELTEWANGIIT